MCENEKVIYNTIISIILLTISITGPLVMYWYLSFIPSIWKNSDKN